MTPWMQVSWMKTASSTLCPGLMMSSTWQVTGYQQELWRRCAGCAWRRGSEGTRLCSLGDLFCLQSVLLHSAVGDCAVVGLEDSLKGHIPLALCVLKNGEDGGVALLALSS